MENISHVISSPFKRAVQTVEGIANELGKEIEIIDGFKERLLSDRPVVDFNEAIKKVWSNFDFSLDGGESNSIAQERGVSATIQVLDKYKGKNIAIGTHGNIMVLIMNYFDPQYDIHFWEQLAMPDIFKLTFHDKHLIEVKRLDENEVNLLNTGYTIYKSLGIKIDYPYVNLEKKRVTGTVSFNKKLYLTVTVDLLTNTAELEGDIDDLARLTVDEITENDYIEMIKSNAVFLIENKISKPKEYFDKITYGAK
jgi:2,3-bisphosphoglycerate-dependent phosphoglycerate mutase